MALSSVIVAPLALGARCVFIGRLLLWGLACNGADGSSHVFNRTAIPSVMEQPHFLRLMKYLTSRNPYFDYNHSGVSSLESAVDALQYSGFDFGLPSVPRQQMQQLNFRLVVEHIHEAKFESRFRDAIFFFGNLLDDRFVLVWIAGWGLDRLWDIFMSNTCCMEPIALKTNIFSFKKPTTLSTPRIDPFSPLRQHSQSLLLSRACRNHIISVVMSFINLS